MISPNDDPNTKPSRLNRRRKKKWKIADLIKSGLTDCARVAMLFTAGTSSAGRRNLVSSIGEKKSPQSIAAFLCLPFSMALCRGLFIMAGCFGQRSALAAPMRGFRPHYSPSPDSVETIGGGYQSSALEPST